MTGSVSERNFAGFSQLTVLRLGSPSLIFDFDPLWVPQFQLIMFELSHILNLEIPAWLYSQTSLYSLSINNSSFSEEPCHKFWDFLGHVPTIEICDNTNVGDLSNLTMNSTPISLFLNDISGTLPRLSQFCQYI